MGIEAFTKISNSVAHAYTYTFKKDNQYSKLLECVLFDTTQDDQRQLYQSDNYIKDPTRYI